MSTYQLEQVHSGRATCKKCKEKISKEEIRMGVISNANDMELKRYVLEYLSLYKKEMSCCFETNQNHLNKSVTTIPSVSVFRKSF
jgi:uncharacterized 2Fe-2S/4Fe-4S cluster protein (DUF4445 family)